MRLFSPGVVIAMLSTAVPTLGYSSGTKHFQPRQGMLGSSEVEIPMELFQGRPVILARINGSEPYRFVIDTASAGSMMDDSLAEKLNLPVVGRNTFGDPANPEAFTTDTVRIEELEIGSVSFSAVSIDRFDMKGFWRGTDSPVGIIGIDLFADLLLTIDAPRQRFVFREGELPDPDGAHVLSYELDQGIPQVSITVADLTVPAHLDTGSNGGIALPSEYMERLAFLSGPTETGQARTVNGLSPVYTAVLDGDIRLGHLAIENPRLTFHALVSSANIGMNVLKDFVITIDQHRRRLRIDSETE